MERLREKYLRLLSSVDLPKKRFLFERINFSDRLIVIKGQQGTGKTTLILQYIKSKFSDIEKILYVSLDDIYFASNTLSDLVDEFVKDGGKYLFIDEVHRYKNWAQEIKNIFDFYPDLYLVITGSSVLDFYINMADLGRRATVYTLPEMSFREYLNINYDFEFQPVKFENIINSAEKLSIEIYGKLKSLKLYREYLKKGAYPFVSINPDSYYDKLEALINTVIDSDIPAIENISYESRHKLKKLMVMLSATLPFKVNISELARKLETTRDVLYKYLYLLSQIGIIRFLSTEGVGHTIFRKPEKIYLSNSNLIYALSNTVNQGTVRETFFLNQVSYVKKVNYSKTADFLIDDKYTFEVGGKNKTQKQIAGTQNSYLALDDIEYGHKNKIPLWLFGFLY